ncbi:MAG: xanthine dehydrogenase family protein subunit M [Caldilineaceae bacterium]|nr:xanthine dehydrogenase family protein subunit M [Caldilineaceae bacterium]
MQPFAYVRATNLEETLRLLDQAATGRTRPLAGGTDLLTLMKSNILAPAQVIDIKRLGELPRGIQRTAQGVTIGALTTLSAIEHSALLRELFPALVEAAEVAATPQLRNMATMGGNLLQRPRCWYFRNQHFHCWLKGGEDCPAQQGENQHHALFGGDPCCAVHPSDLAAALLALDARIQLRGAEGERTLPLADFFALPAAERRQETTLADDELVLAVELPAQPAGARSTYQKAMDRKVWSFALAGVALSLQQQDNRVTQARIVLSGVAPIPWRVPAAEEHLVGAAITPQLLEAVATKAVEQAAPLAQNGYKVPLVRNLLQHALTTLTQPVS